MIILPAIDIRQGKFVRLIQGDPSKETVYGDDPIDAAKNWASKGATYLHLVDLDGAFSGTIQNLTHIEEITKKTGLPIQLGGGIRSIETATQLIKTGVHRVVFGTAVANTPALAGEAVQILGADKVVVGIDAKNGFVAIKGWTKTIPLKAKEFARELANLGVKRLVVTDIARDGVLTGPNIEMIKEIIDLTGINVIASGGIRGADDIKALKISGAEGAIVGKALYSGATTLTDLLEACKC